jgi:hypothetical protein
VVDAVVDVAVDGQQQALREASLSADLRRRNGDRLARADA